MRADSARSMAEEPPLGSVDVAREAGRVSVKRRRERAVKRRMTALDWAAKIVEEEGEALARSFLKAAEEGDWRAADALMNRIYGKPEQAVVAHVAASPAVEVIRSMSLDEKLEPLGRLRAGEVVATTQVVPIVDVVPLGR